MTIEIIDCEQGSPQWFAARAGIPTASEFHTVMAVGPKGGKSLTRVAYLNKLVGEIVTGEPMAPGYSSPDMERGKIMEDEARELYCFAHNVDPIRVGFLRNGDKGASPDSLLGENGGLEIKSAAAHVQVARLLADIVPPEHLAQIHGNIWIAERQWWDFASYCPKMPLFVKRVYRDEDYIKKLALAVDLFNVELHQTVEYVRHYGRSEAA